MPGGLGGQPAALGMRRTSELEPAAGFVHRGGGGGKQYPAIAMATGWLSQEQAGPIHQELSPPGKMQAEAIAAIPMRGAA